MRGAYVAAPAGAAELVSIPSKGPGPAEFDQVFVNKIGPDDAKRVLVLMPGRPAAPATSR